MNIVLSKSNKKAATIVLLVILVTVTSSAIVPLWGDFLTSIGGNIKSAGIAVAIVNVGTAVFTAIMAFLEKKYAKSLPIFTVIGFLLLSLAYFNYIFISSVTELYCVLMLISMANGMIWPAFNTLYQTTFEAENGSIFWAIFNLSYDIGAGIGAFVGAHTVSAVGFSKLFLLLSCLCFLGFIFSLYFHMKNRASASSTLNLGGGV